MHSDIMLCTIYLLNFLFRTKCDPALVLSVEDSLEHDYQQLRCSTPTSAQYDNVNISMPHSVSPVTSYRGKKPPLVLFQRPNNHMQCSKDVPDKFS
jgi:hypothetical protein